MKRLIPAILLLSVFVFQDSQAQRKKAERAYEAFNAGEYYEAIDQFKDAYSKSKKADRSVRT